MTIIASWGGQASNCYVAVTEAYSFIATGIVDNLAWTAASTVQREAALIEATRDIDSKEYVGGRYYYDQNLSFPRAVNTGYGWQGPVRTDSSSASYNITLQHMERDVKQANCWQALYILRNGGRNEHQERIAAGIESWSEGVGPMKEYVSYGSGGKGNKMERLSLESKALLSRWMTSRKIARG